MSVNNQIGGTAQLTGVTVQARTVFGGVHHHVSAAPLPIPRQLPPIAVHFTDREEDQNALDAAWESGARLFVISGIGGVGKSALASRWLAARTYPDGHLYVDLSAPGEPVPPEVVLRRWLRAFGIDQPPADLEELSGLWRSVTATRTVALLADGATEPAQVRPLLPAGADSSTVVTSRSALRELAVNGAVHHSLRPFTRPAALQLLARLAGQERIDAVSGDAVRLIEACHRLPLPLVLAGARVASRPQHSVAAVVDALAHRTPLAHTHSEDPAQMITNTALDQTYQDLQEDTQHIYRSLGLLPVREVDPDMTAAITGLPWGQAEWGLEVLADEQLLEPLEDQGDRLRYRLIPAARDHARSLALQHDPEHDRVRVLRRLCEWVLATCTQAQFRLTPAQATLRRSTTNTPSPMKAPFDDDAGALAWLESFEGSLLDILRAAEAAQWDEIAWQLVDCFWPLFLRRHPYELWAAAHEIGVAAARRAHNDAAVRQMLASGAIGLSAAGRLDDAIDWYTQALEAAREHHDVRDEGQALLGLGSCHHTAGRPDQALPLLARAINVWQECGYPRGVALATIVLGEIALAEDAGRALDLFVQARTMLLEADDPYDATRALVLQGHARVLVGDVEAGIGELENALGTLTDAGSTRWRARALELLGRAHHDRGEPAAASACWQQAVDLYAGISPADAERVQVLAGDL